MNKISNSSLLKYYNENDIICIEAESSYSTIHLLEDKKILTSKTLKHWESLMPKENMLRVHKSFSINKTYIKSILKQTLTIEMMNGQLIPISRSQKKTVFTTLICSLV